VTVVSTLFSVIGIFALAFGMVFVTGYYHSKKRDAYFFTIADSESSSSSGEDEIYHKSKTHNKTEVTLPYSDSVGWMIMTLVENKHLSEASFGGQ